MALRESYFFLTPGVIPQGCRMQPVFSTENQGSRNLDPVASPAPAVERAEDTAWVGEGGRHTKSASLHSRWSQEGRETQRCMKSRLGCHQVDVPGPTSSQRYQVASKDSTPLGSTLVHLTTVLLRPERARGGDRKHISMLWGQGDQERHQHPPLPQAAAKLLEMGRESICGMAGKPWLTGSLSRPSVCVGTGEEGLAGMALVSGHGPPPLLPSWSTPAFRKQSPVLSVLGP